MPAWYRGSVSGPSRPRDGRVTPRLQRRLFTVSRAEALAIYHANATRSLRGRDRACDGAPATIEAQRWKNAVGRTSSLKRLALVTDAWRPQTNGVVNTLVRLVKHLESSGTEVLVIAPDAHRTVAAAVVPGDPRGAGSVARRSSASARSSPTRFTSRPRGRSASGPSAGCADRACASRPASTPATRST